MERDERFSGWNDLAAAQGFEPQLPVPETGVLPLDDAAKRSQEKHNSYPDCSIPESLERAQQAAPLLRLQRRQIRRLRGQVALMQPLRARLQRALRVVRRHTAVPSCLT